MRRNDGGIKGEVKSDVEREVKREVTGEAKFEVRREVKGEDGRAFPRNLIHEKAAIILLGDALRIDCEVLDLSLGGCRLRLCEAVVMEPDAQVEVLLRIHGMPMRFGGTVRWSDSRHRLGILFVGMSKRCEAALQGVMEELKASRRAMLMAAQEGRRVQSR